MAEIIDERYEREPNGWRKRRLLAIKLVAHGEMTSAQIADICDIARGHLFTWIGIVQEGGLDALLTRRKVVYRKEPAGELHPKSLRS